MNIDPRSLVMGIFIGAGFILTLHSIILLLRPWRHAFFADAPVPMPQIIGMRLRGNPALLLVDAYILLRKTDVNVQIGYVEVVYIDNKNAIDSPEKLAELVKRYLKENENSSTSASS